MEEYTSLTRAVPGYENPREILRGYDPRREFAHWQQIILQLFLGIILISWFFMSGLENLDTLTHTAKFWGLLTILILFPVVGIGLCALLLQSYRAEQKHRKACRQAALQGVLQAGKQKLSILPPPTFAEGFSLPLLIESRVKRGYVVKAAVSVVFMCVFLGLSYVLIVNMLTLPEILGAFVMLPLMGTFVIALVSGRSIVRQTASYYFLPSLHVDADGIRARYGHTAFVIHWHDMRHFALTETIETAVSGRKASATTYKNSEVFEISDGENVICWLASTPSRVYDLLRSGEVPLAREDYNTFAVQLAVLVAERTGLPLYDFRAQGFVATFRLSLGKFTCGDGVHGPGA